MPAADGAGVRVSFPGRAPPPPRRQPPETVSGLRSSGSTYFWSEQQKQVKLYAGLLHRAQLGCGVDRRLRPDRGVLALDEGPVSASRRLEARRLLGDALLPLQERRLAARRAGESDSCSLPSKRNLLPCAFIVSAVASRVWTIRALASSFSARSFSSSSLRARQTCCLRAIVCLCSRPHDLRHVALAHVHQHVRVGELRDANSATEEIGVLAEVVVSLAFLRSLIAAGRQT